MSERLETMSQIKRTIKKINRNHKLYYRDSKGAVRRLDKISKSINGNILVAFIKGDASEHYSRLNADVKHWSELKPLTMNVQKDEQEDYQKLKKAVGSNSIIISYNGSWRPLVNLGAYKPQEVTSEEVVEELETVE
jgi:hypothetical protein